MLTFFATARFLLHFHTYVMLRYCKVSLALPHIRHATPLLGFSCTSTHTSCYATARFLLHFHAYVMLRYCKVSLSLPHIRHATLLLVFSFTSTHTSCYATARFLLHFHTYVGKAVPVNPLKGQYSCHTKFRKPGLSLKNVILCGKTLKNQYFR